MQSDISIFKYLLETGGKGFNLVLIFLFTLVGLNNLFLNFNKLKKIEFSDDTIWV